MNPTLQKRLINYLQTELAIPAEDIAMAMRHQSDLVNQLPVVLWNYGLVTLSQVNSIFEWLETASMSTLTES